MNGNEKRTGGGRNRWFAELEETHFVPRGQSGFSQGHEFEER